MQKANTYSEERRLAALFRLGILDSPPEEEFDELTRLAAAALNVASAGISLVDDRRQWFKARHGIAFTETRKDIAFCTHAVNGREAFVVPDAHLDTRFRTNPLVTAPGGIRFYAGVPLITQAGDCMGVFCVFDPSPREGLSETETLVLRDLALLALDLIQSRRTRRMGEIAGKVMDATSDAILAVDSEGLITYWNPAAEKMFARPVEDALGQSADIIMPVRLLKKYRAAFASVRGGAKPSDGTFIELTALRADGTEFPVEFSLAHWGASGSDQGVAAIIRDISARKSLEHDREQARAFLDNVVTNLPAMLFVKDVESRQYLMVNRAGETLIGRSLDQIIGFTDRELFPQYGDGYEQRDAQAIASARPHVFESVFTRDDGQEVHLRTTRKLIDGPDNSRQYLLGISEDVTQTRLAQAEVVRLAHYDSLTGLLNRASYSERLERALKAEAPFALITLDLDRFKAINDQFGHLIGDEVLAEVGRRLHAGMRGEDWVARIGGDEFVAVLFCGPDQEVVRRATDALIQCVNEPVKTSRGMLELGVSAGVVCMPKDGRTVRHLRENADLALYRAKQNGRGRACYFDGEMDAAARDRRDLEIDLRAAVANREITLAYQPLVSIANGRITSAEALARWTHPTRGPISPEVFVSLGEQCDLIDILGQQLLEKACHEAVTWPGDVRVAVNLSPMQFLSGELPKTVRKILRNSGLSPYRLQLEVTESLVIRDVERTFAQLQELRALGIQIVIDDFGVGYSSLSYFQRFPFDKVKIDKSFVGEIATSRTSNAIVQAVVGLGRQLDMGVVAEGVETEEQMQVLTNLGCTHLQGYLFSRPLPASAFRGLLNATLNLPIRDAWPAAQSSSARRA